MVLTDGGIRGLEVPERRQPGARVRRDGPWTMSFLRRRQRRPVLLRPGVILGQGAVLTLVNGALAGVGGVSAGTHSVLITVVAAVVLAVLAFPR
jgi:hypothetical protein